MATVDPKLVHRGNRDRDFEIVATIHPETGEAVITRRRKPDATLVPNGVRYERLTLLLIDVARRLREQVDALAARVAAAEGRSG